MDNKSFLELNDLYHTKDEKDKDVFDDVEIIIDPELEDESTVDINNYLNKFILQCRICGNLFPSDEMLDNENECPICNSKSSDGFIFKGKLKKKKEEDNLTDEEKSALDELADESEQISIEGDYNYNEDDLSNIE